MKYLILCLFLFSCAAEVDTSEEEDIGKAEQALTATNKTLFGNFPSGTISKVNVPYNQTFIVRFDPATYVNGLTYYNSFSPRNPNALTIGLKSLPVRLNPSCPTNPWLTVCPSTSWPELAGSCWQWPILSSSGTFTMPLYPYNAYGPLNWGYNPAYLGSWLNINVKINYPSHPACLSSTTIYPPIQVYGPAFRLDYVHYQWEQHEPTPI